MDKHAARCHSWLTERRMGTTKGDCFEDTSVRKLGGFLRDFDASLGSSMEKSYWNYVNERTVVHD